MYWERNTARQNISRYIKNAKSVFKGSTERRYRDFVYDVLLRFHRFFLCSFSLLSVEFFNSYKIRIRSKDGRLYVEKRVKTDTGTVWRTALQ